MPLAVGGCHHSPVLLVSKVVGNGSEITLFKVTTLIRVEAKSSHLNGS